MSDKIMVYEFDFGDTNLIDKDPDVIIDWIKTDLKDMVPGEEVQYTITTKLMTQEEIDALPEWS